MSAARDMAVRGTAAMKAVAMRHKADWTDEDRADIQDVFEGLRAVMDAEAPRPVLDDAELDEIAEEIREARG